MTAQGSTAAAAARDDGQFAPFGLVRRRPSLVRLFLADRGAVTGTVLVLLVVIAALGAQHLAPFDPTRAQVSERIQPPSFKHLLGTDVLGRDVLSRVLYGAQISLLVSVTSVAAALILGVPLGLIAGYYKGKIDQGLMRVTDVMFAIPSILLALALVAVLGTAVQNVILAIAIVYTPSFARVARGSTLSVREMDYVLAAQACGAGDLRIMLNYLLPNIASPLTVQATVAMAYAILTEASLSFLGVGVQPPTPTWGNILNEGKPYMESMPWLTIVPGVAIMVAVMGFNLLGDAIRDVLDPRTRSSSKTGA